MICVDASLAVKWIVEEEDSDRAWSLYRATAGAGEPIVAPPLLPIEVTNVLRQQMRRLGGPLLAEATAWLNEFLSFPIALLDPVGLHRAALVLADAHGLPAAYDAHYLTLAQHLGCDFWTADQRLLNRPGNALSFVRSLGSYVLPGRSGGDQE